LDLHLVLNSPAFAFCRAQIFGCSVLICPPSPVGRMPRSSGLLSQTLRPIIKKPLHRNPLPDDYSSDTVSCRNSAPSSRTLDHHHHSDGCIVQGEKTDAGWQLVRHPRWWRRSRIVPSKPLHAASLRRRQKFSAKLKGHCFHCFAKDHRHSHCRDPSRCWRCKKSGHISSSCPRLFASHPILIISIHPPSSAHLHSSLPQSRWIIADPLAAL
jgi:hypothetical protein